MDSKQIGKYWAAKQAPDSLILATPSGDVRNKLTEANIALLEAEDLAKKESNNG